MATVGRQITIAGLLLAGATLISLLLFLTRPEPPRTTVELPPLVVDVASVVLQNARIDIESQGTVVPARKTRLTSEVTGALVWLSPKFHDGGMFEAGDVLLRVDDRNYLAEVKRAEANVAAAHSQLIQEKGRGAVAKREWLRNPKRKQMGADARALALREPQLAEAAANLASAEAMLEKARSDLNRTEILAPFDGLLRNKSVELGQFVSTGAALAELYGTETAEVRLPVPEDRLDYLRRHLPAEDTGDPVAVTLFDENTPGGTWRAALVRSEGVLDERSHVLFVVAQLQDPYGLKNSRDTLLRFGSFVTARIEGREFSDVVAVPRHLLRAGNQLWLVDDNGNLRARTVETLRGSGDLAWVSNGLRAGEQIAMTALPPGIAGRRVSINTSTPSTEIAQRYLNRVNQSNGTDIHNPRSPRTAALGPQ